MGKSVPNVYQQLVLSDWLSQVRNQIDVNRLLSISSKSRPTEFSTKRIIQHSYKVNYLLSFNFNHFLQVTFEEYTKSQ